MRCPVWAPKLSRVQMIGSQFCGQRSVTVHHQVPKIGGMNMVARLIRPKRSSFVVCSYPEPETEKERSPLDYPQEWITPQPSRRPDIFPEFEKLETPMPKPLPGDPEQPDEEEEVEKEKKQPDPDKEDEEEEEKPEEPQPDSPD